MLAKGLNGQQRAALIIEKAAAMKRPRFIMMDGRQCDLHMKEHMLKAQHIFDKSIIDDPDYDQWCYIMRKTAILHGPGGFKAKVSPVRLTGSPDTGGGNSAIHMLFLTWTLRSMKKSDGTPRWNAVVDGDDIVLIVEREDADLAMSLINASAEALALEFTQDGMSDDIRDVEFCRCHPIELADGWTMVRAPARTIQNTFLNTVELNSKSISAYMKTLSNGERRCFAGVPILGPLFMKIYEDNKHHADYKGTIPDARKWQRILNETRDFDLPITAKARLDYEQAFGISVPEQFELEKQISLTKFEWEFSNEVEPCPYIVHDDGTWTHDPSINMILMSCAG